MNSMHVDVVELFRLGVRRSREAVRGDTPVRAELDLDRLWTWSAVEPQSTLVHAHLDPMVLEPLYRAKVVLMRRHHILIWGLQRAAAYTPRAKEELYQQMWWCRLVRTAPVDPPQGADRAAQPKPDQSARHRPG